MPVSRAVEVEMKGIRNRDGRMACGLGSYTLRAAIRRIGPAALRTIGVIGILRRFTAAPSDRQCGARND